MLDVVARHGLVLATGHLGARRDLRGRRRRGRSAGVRDVVVTHPEFPSQALEPADQVELADRGALLERCFTTPYTGKCTWERVFEATRAVGAERTVWRPISASSPTRRSRTGWR